MGMMSRMKGQRAEREVCRMLQQLLDEVYGAAAPRVERNSLQSSSGGHDLVDVTGVLSWLAVEVKHHEQEQLESWWQQTVEQAQKVNAVPVLFYRKNNARWRVATWVSLSTVPVEKRIRGILTLDDALFWLRSEFTARPLP